MNKEAERNQRKALGKGLSALLPSRGRTPEPAHAAPPASVEEPSVSPPAELPANFEAFESIQLDEIQPGPQQPRESFDNDKLQELAQSIRANGLIQPITVQKLGAGKYEIIAGERRWRAARLAGLESIPALVRHAEDHERLELALIENIQREDLNPLEIAEGFLHLAQEHGLSHEEIAQRTGKDRSTVTNFLRLLKLNPHVREALSQQKISMGHARALLNISDAHRQNEACDEIVSKGLSVRQTEAFVKRITDRAAPDQHGDKTSPDAASGLPEEAVDPNIRAAIEEMSRVLGTRVRLVQRAAGSGRVEIEYYSPEDLDRIYSAIVSQ
jgi:ParB family chromosome partitioning protein